jgi:Ser-tRNA(Ala) deacylase AlaX
MEIMTFCMHLQDGLRMLELDTLDLNPCGGTHLRSLSEIQLIKVRNALQWVAP